MGSTCNSRLGNFARTSISFVCYDRGSLNISLGNNPAFLEGRHYYVCMASAVISV